VFRTDPNLNLDQLVGIQLNSLFDLIYFPFLSFLIFIFPVVFVFDFRMDYSLSVFFVTMIIIFQEVTSQPSHAFPYSSLPEKKQFQEEN
jgi:hypothetical protein